MSDSQRSGVARDLIENEKLVRLSRSLHAAWRDAVRTPWRNLRRRLRDALPVSSEGVPLALDEATDLAVVPYEGGLPPPLSRCEVIAAAQYRTRLHPLSVNSTNAERVHYIDHTVHAPAMTLEHLVDQYWFPAFGLLISPEGHVWRHSFLGPFQEGYLSSIKAIVRRPQADGTLERRLHLERLARAPRIAGEHLLIAGSDKHNYGHYLHDIVPLIDLGARMGAPMLTWRLRPWQRALIARLEVSGGPHPRDPAKASLSRTCDHVEQVHGSEQPERTSSRPRSVRAYPGQRAKACAGDEHAAACAHLPQPVEQPKRHQSGGDDRGAQGPRFRRDPAGQAGV